MKLISVVGARPQFIKLAPLVQAIRGQKNSNKKPKVNHIIIHTGQHYDYEMNKIFFTELDIPEPEYNLEVGSGFHGWQTGEMIKRLEPILMKEKPALTIVYGDTNSTLAGALAAVKLQIPIVHIEAGLRSYNRKMPEEINRILTDHCSDILFCPTENGVKNLKKEGYTNIINDGKLINPSFSTSQMCYNKFPVVVNVGDIMYDATLISLKIAEKKSDILKQLKRISKQYFLVTIHRAENTDNKRKLKNILDALIEIGKCYPVVFPVHPRTKKTLKNFNLLPSNYANIHLIDPVSYFDMLTLEKNARKILTDSGGIQKEAYFLGVPCITLRNETEWIETVKSGNNVIVGTNRKNIVRVALHSSPVPKYMSRFLYGDGQTAQNILKYLCPHKR